MKILIFGFSVTAGKDSYALRLQECAKANQDIEIDVCGIGGIQPLHAAFLLGSILDRKKYDFVLLDIFSSAYRNLTKTTTDDLHWTIWYIAELCLRRSAFPILLSLYRRDVDYSNDAFTKAANYVAHALAIPFFDIATKLATLPDAAKMFIDEVHPTPSGHEYYANNIIPIIESCLEHKFQPLHREFLFQEELHCLCASGESNIFERTGYAAPYFQVEGNQFKTINFPEQVFINGISYISGPRSGYIFIDIGDGKKRQVLTYDSFSYYERFSATMLTPLKTATLKISIDEKMPDIKLRKGQPDTSPRTAKVCHFFYSKRPVLEIINNARHAWTDSNIP